MDKHFVDVNSALTRMEALEGQGKTAMLMAVDGHLAGIIAVADTVKETSAEAIKQLKKMGIEVITAPPFVCSAKGRFLERM